MKGWLLRVPFLFLVLLSLVNPSWADEDQVGTPEEDVLFTTSELKKFRDPFKAPEIQVEAEEVSPLKRISVNEFKLLAVLTGPLKMRAMITDAAGNTYTVAKSTPIGLRGGEVIKITTQAVVVREKIPNPLGEIENIDTEIRFVDQSGSNLLRR